MYIWASNLATGNDTIDTQHKQLFDAINNLMNACLKLKAQEEIKSTMKFLSDYTVKHFADEERLQIGSKYPDYTRHKTLHDNFKLTVSKLRQELEAKPDDMDIVARTAKSVGDWLLMHIQREDVALGKHLAGK